MDPIALMLFVGALTLLGVGATIYVAFGRYFEAEARRRKRLAKIEGVKREANRTAARQRQQAHSQQQLAQRLKEMGKAEKKRASFDVAARLTQAGSTLSTLQFLLIFYALAVLAAGATVVLSQQILVAGCVALMVAFGLPRLVLAKMIQRRQRKFIENFANSIDVLVRGVRSGLPINEGLKLIASEMPEPVRSEFRLLVDSTSVGVPIEDALSKMHERMPLSEVNFFRTVLVIQKQTGGNLSEALSNLSGILRDRKKLKGKIKALSSEARMSAMIIGSLPFLVGGMVYMVTPDYIMTLFTDPRGHMLVGGGLIWMSFGVMMMRSMINFDM